MSPCLLALLLNPRHRYRVLLCLLLLILVICDWRERKEVVSMCPELSSSSQGYFRVQLTNQSSLYHRSICKSEDHLLVYILSTYRNLKRRESIRRTWANGRVYQQLKGVCFIFIVGLATRVGGRNESLVDVSHESFVYNDIVQLNIEETYANVVFKEVGALKWSSMYASHIPYLFKTDDDLVLDTFLLNDVIRYLVSNYTNQSLYLRKKDNEVQKLVSQLSTIDRYTLFKGTDLGGIDTFRQGKFRIHQLAWNHHKLPPYCSGFGFLFSSFIRDRLYRASLCYGNEYVPLVGDVFVSGFLAGAASVRCSRWLLVNVQTGESCAKLFEKNGRLLVCSTSLHGGGQAFGDFDLAWKSIVRRHALE